MQELLLKSLYKRDVITNFDIAEHQPLNQFMKTGQIMNPKDSKFNVIIA